MANEKRLIDANAFWESVSTDYWEHFTQCHTTDQIDLMEMVEENLAEQPTVDAVEVVHGRWECAYDEIMGETEVICSNCKDTRTINGCFVTTEGESCYFEDNYCPNCGAKMDGGVNSD